MIFPGMLISCNDKNDKGNIEGEYINDQTIGLSLVGDINFKNAYCNFNYVGISMGGKYTIDKDYIFIEAGGEFGTLSLKITDKDTLVGEGWITGRFVKQKQ